MPFPKIDSEKKYSYADYMNWPDNERWELIDGVPYDMSPAPNTKHQEVLGVLHLLIGAFLAGKSCKVFLAPLDVRFKNEIHAVDNETYTVVQPDILVVCDKSKIDEKGIVGPPDICIEILSESTSYKDEGEKYKLYEKHAVKEYWVVNPVVESIAVFKHNGGSFEKPEYYKKEDVLSSSVLPGLKIKLAEVFYTENEEAKA